MPEPITLSSHTAARRSAKSRRRRAASNAANQADDADATDNADDADNAHNADHAATRSRVPHAGDHPPPRPLQPSSHGVFKALKGSFPSTPVRLLADNPKAGQKNEKKYHDAMVRERGMAPGTFTVREYLESNTVSDLRYDYARGYLELGQLTALAAAAPPYLVALLSPTTIPSFIIASSHACHPAALPALLSAAETTSAADPAASEVPNDPIFMPYAIDCSRLVQLPRASPATQTELAAITADAPPTPLNPAAPTFRSPAAPKRSRAADVRRNERPTPSPTPPPLPRRVTAPTPLDEVLALLAADAATAAAVDLSPPPLSLS